ncbi:hypothetical protein C8J57DRAFT_1268070 [Mycena rebaudengoi]|nr:hypothetical protein C8J57DRAFT_1268070 [Mycena rebaudengoi]
MDVSTLRAEIKAWERSFKVNNGRNASVQDIREQPEIAEKYKQYKKLSKAAAPSLPSSTVVAPPSTPPKSPTRASHPSLLLSKPRSIASAQPLPGYNPFSPQKNKGKQKALDLAADSRSNPFHTTRDPSPNPFPLILPSLSAAEDPFTLDPPAATSAVSRARKRFRGEPVSPSPNKEKRRRIISVPHDESDEDEDSAAANTSFVDDSPVKAPNGARSFKLLFDEMKPSTPKFPSLGSKPLPSGLFGQRTSAVRDEEGENRMDVDGLTPLKPTKHILKVDQDDMFTSSSNVRKRSNSHSMDDDMVDKRLSPQPAVVTRNLLAPSPPPPDQRVSGNSQAFNSKGKAKAKLPAAGHQKPTLPESGDGDFGSDEDADMNEPQHKVRVFNRTASRRRLHGDNDLDADADPILPYSRRDTDADTETQPSESISLPETLLSILSLAPASFMDGRMSEFGALGSRGDMRGDRDDEDDWEGEGVPWEVGEL